MLPKIICKRDIPCAISGNLLQIIMSIVLSSISYKAGLKIKHISFSSFQLSLFQIHRALGDLCLTIFASTIFTLLFESPLIAAEKVYVGEGVDYLLSVAPPT